MAKLTARQVEGILRQYFGRDYGCAFWQDAVRDGAASLDTVNLVVHLAELDEAKTETVRQMLKAAGHEGRVRMLKHTKLSVLNCAKSDEVLA